LGSRLAPVVRHFRAHHYSCHARESGHAVIIIVRDEVAGARGYWIAPVKPGDDKKMG
jgi:hypothetical protein